MGIAISMSFDDFVTQLNLNYFRAGELLVATDRSRNQIPDRKLWDNIVPTILIIDELRDYLEVPICLTSVYRHPPYNATLEGAAPRSLHQAFAAADLFIKSEHLDRRGISLETVFEILKSWQNLWFESPVPIQTAPVSIGRNKKHHMKICGFLKSTAFISFGLGVIFASIDVISILTRGASTIRIEQGLSNQSRNSRSKSVFSVEVRGNHVQEPIENYCSVGMCLLHSVVSNGSSRKGKDI